MAGIISGKVIFTQIQKKYYAHKCLHIAIYKTLIQIYGKSKY